jgi:hypothetical protein
MNGGFVELRVYADGNTIGHLNTGWRHLYAQVCSLNQAEEIDALRRLIPEFQREAKFCDRIQQRDPGALTEDALRHGCQINPEALYLIYRENAIRRGAFGKSAQQAREAAARHIQELYRLLAGPVEKCNRLFVRSWPRSQSQAHRAPRWAKIVDVLDIPTGLPRGRVSHTRADISAPE